MLQIITLRALEGATCRVHMPLSVELSPLGRGEDSYLTGSYCLSLL